MVGRRSSLVVLALLTFAVLLPAESRAQTCQTHTGLTYATYIDRYGQTQELKLELLVPSGATAPAPLVIWVHGGGWKSGSRLPIPSYVEALCSQGYAVASLDYRLTTTALWPAQIQDCKTAVRWLRANASTYNLDPDRFAAWGASAGAHLASMLGTAGGVSNIRIGNAAVDLEGSGNSGVSSGVQAVVHWYGATDFLHMRFYPSTINHDLAGSDESRLVGGAIQQRPELVATANPITYVTPDDPPFLVMHGAVDKTIPFNQSQILVDALAAAGVPVTFIPVLNAGHGGSLFTQAVTYQPVYDFLNDVLVEGNLSGSAQAASVSEPAADESTPGLPAVRVTATDALASETAPNGGVLTITRDGDIATNLTVAYTLSGTAANGADYAALSGSATIPAGQASVAVAVAPLNDDALETAETVILTLAASPSYSVVSPETASVAIEDTDLDPAKPVVSVAVTDLQAAERGVDRGSFLLWRTGSVTNPLTVELVPSGTADSGTDYTGAPVTVTFPTNYDRVAVTLSVVDDFEVEGPETAVLNVLPDPAIQVAPYDLSTVTIADDDVAGGPSLVSVTLNPASVLGAQASTGTVQLSAPAPAGGLSITLSSANTAVATVPGSVVVPQGASTATFTVSTQAVATATPVDISASRQVTVQATLTIQPPAVSNLTLTSTSIAGGCKTTIGKVTLSGKAPASGLVVPLATANPAAVVPASVTVPAGGTSVSFTVSASAVAASQTGAITASYEGSSRSATLTVRPVGVGLLTLGPNPVTGPESATGTVTLECPAAPGDIVVGLTSGSPSIAKPAVTSLTIPAGSTTGTFTITTADVAAVSSASIRANANNLARSAVLTVNP